MVGVLDGTIHIVKYPRVVYGAASTCHLRSARAVNSQCLDGEEQVRGSAAIIYCRLRVSRCPRAA